MSLNFDKMGGILPAIIQDAQTNEVLMLGFMNQEAYEKTVSEGKVTFYSRTRKRLWTKGEESGNFMDVVEILEDCDADTLLIRANPQGPACHTGMRTCFGETDQDNLAFLQNLQALLQSRKEELPENSYTAKLFRQGPRKIAKKLGEEATELVIEAMDSDNECFLNEAADLLFHMTILLVDRGYRLEDVAKILADRHQSG
jgi:phosphoribosyl-ATP pyrophosphohydrolase/phosphoribosyl-AMP cyclohydrolase